MSFGRSFHTLKEARAYKKKVKNTKITIGDFKVRQLSKKLFPRRKKLYHVGSHLDFLNFA